MAEDPAKPLAGRAGRGGGAERFEDDLPPVFDAPERPGVVLPQVRRGGRAIQQHHALPEHLLNRRDAACGNRIAVEEIASGRGRLPFGGVDAVPALCAALSLSIRQELVSSRH